MKNINLNTVALYNVSANTKFYLINFDIVIIE